MLLAAKILDLKPELTGTVEADLPDETFLSSSMSTGERQAKIAGGSFKSSSNDGGSATKKSDELGKH
jgi:hypothetical protein